MPWFMWLALLGFFAGVMYSMFAIGKATAGGDNRADMASAITNVTIVNVVLTLVLAGTAYFYIASEPLAEHPYMLFMTHLALLISIISVSVSSLHQLNSASGAK